jgi:hypothetical protein
METTDRLVPWLLIAALVAGVSGDLLLNTPVWGIGFSAWGIVLLGLLLALERMEGAFPPFDVLAVGVLGGLCALCLAWRDSASLSFANVLAFFFAAGLMTLRARPLTRAPIALILQGFILHGLHAAAGLPMLGLKDLPAWRRSHPSGPVRILPLLRGIFLALPFLIFFGALLAAADASFQFLLEQMFDIPEILRHLFVAGFFCWLVGGVLRGRHCASEVPLPGERPKFLHVGTTESAIVLGALNILFGLFVVLQLPYFFGGHQTVLGTPSLTYAEYARRGFFELIGVVGFAIPLLLLVEWLSFRQGSAPMFRVLGGMMVVLLGSIMASALWRLWLYVERFGLTEARLNAVAVLAWLALVLLWFCATVLAGRRERFTYGAIIAGYVLLLLLNAGNPGAIVARTNIARASAGVPFDARYNVTLGADAVPDLVAGLGALPEAERDEVSWELLTRYGSGGYAFSRGWNAGSARAYRRVETEKDELRSHLIPRKTLSIQARAGCVKQLPVSPVQ